MTAARDSAMTLEQVRDEMRRAHTGPYTQGFHRWSDAIDAHLTTHDAAVSDDSGMPVAWRQHVLRDRVCDHCDGQKGGVYSDDTTAKWIACNDCGGTGVHVRGEDELVSEVTDLFPSSTLDDFGCVRLSGNDFAKAWRILKSQAAAIESLASRKVAVPDGYVLVPVEPTDAMCSAPDAVWHPEARKIWKQMIAASQDEVAVPDEQDGEVILEHSGCGHGAQINQLTVKLYPGDKVLMFRGRLGKAMLASQDEVK